MTDIAIINRYHRVRDARYQALLPVLQAQVSQDFAPMWGADATLHFIGLHDPVPTDPTIWKCWLLGQSDQAGDLGYHDDPSGTPEAKIFVADDLQYGAQISVTISHELLEMLGDPDTQRLTGGGTDSSVQYAIEVSDPVEADEDGYDRVGPDGKVYRVSNFCLPAYFGLANPDGSQRYDWLNLLTGPVPTLRPGGYQLAFANGSWTTIAARHADGTLSHRATKPLGRSWRVASR